MSELTNGKVYKFECKAEPTETQYWILTSDLENQILTTEAFESDFRQYELFKEKFTTNGTEVVEFISYVNDQSGNQISLENIPIEVDVFKWNTDETYKYSAETDYFGKYKTIFTKEREFVGKSRISIFGKDYDAIKLKGRYKNVVIDSNDKFEYIQYSYYVKGIGLVRMEKEYSVGKKEILELTEIMTVDQWNSRQ